MSQPSHLWTQKATEQHLDDKIELWVFVWFLDFNLIFFNISSAEVIHSKQNMN